MYVFENVFLLLIHCCLKEIYRLKGITCTSSLKSKKFQFQVLKYRMITGYPVGKLKTGLLEGMNRRTPAER